MSPAVAPHPPRQNPNLPPPPAAAAPMTNPRPHLGLGLAPPQPQATDPSVAPPPTRRAPRLAKRRHAATTSRYRAQPSPATAGPWNPFGGGGTDGSAQGGSDGIGHRGDAGGSSEPEKGQSGGFVFGATAAASQQPQQPAAASSNEAPFEFGGVRDSLPLFDEGWSTASKLQDKMGKMNLRGSGKGGDASGKGVGQKDGSSIFGVDIPSLVSNKEANVLPEKLTKLNIGSSRVPLQNEIGVEEAFVSGSNGAGSFPYSRNTASSGADSHTSSSVHVTEANGLPEKTTQFNLGSQMPSGRIRNEAKNGTPVVFMSGSSTSKGYADTANDVASGGSTNNPSTVNGTHDATVLMEKITQLNIGRGTPSQPMNSGAGGSHQAEVFLFGSGRTAGTVFGNASSSISDKSSDFFSAASSNSSSSVNGLDSLPPDRTPDLNVGGGVKQSMKSDDANCPPEAFVFGRNRTTSSATGQSASVGMDDAGNFVSGASRNPYASVHGTAGSTLPEEMTKLNIQHEIPSQSMEHEAATRPPEEFVFGSNVTSSFSSAQTARASFADLQTNISSETEDSGRNLANEDIRIVSSSDSNSTTRSEGAAENALQDDIENLNISREGPSFGWINVSDPRSHEFLFQSKAEAMPGYGTIPQPKVEESCPSTPLDHSSSFSIFGSAIPSFSSTTMNAGRETDPGESCTVSKESLFGINFIKSAYRDKNDAHKRTRKNKRPTSLKQRTQHHQGSQETCTDGVTSDLAGDYSPMDCSPYRAEVEQLSREASVDSDQPALVHVSSGPNQNASCAEEDLVSATEHLVIDADLPTYEYKGRVPNSNASDNNFASTYSRFDQGVNFCNTSQPSFTNVNVGATVEPEKCTTGYECNVDGQTCEENTFRTPFVSGGPVTFQSSSANLSGLNFTFGASLSPERPLPTQRRNTRRKLRTKGSQVSKPSATQTSVQPNALQDTKRMQSSAESETKNPRKDKSTKNASISAALETCETWRTSGNKAYANGHFATAEGCYTRGINSISSHGTSGRCPRALMLCYSNRAATRMSLGRMREALQDCLIATTIDPTFIKAKVRAANCQLALGDLEDASRNYTACLKLNDTAGSDIKILGEASDGLERVKRVSEWVSNSKELLKKRTLPEARTALEFIAKALDISSHSDNLMQMKAEALLMLRRYEEAIQFCQETIDLAERNYVSPNANGETNNSGESEMTECPGRLWRSYLICKSYFLLGKLEEALDLLKKNEGTTVKDSDQGTSRECFSSLSTSIRQLLSFKAAGNESFQARRYSEAVEQYSAALARNSDSRPFSAVCFCNRVAAYQALGQLTEAIADCSLAMVLDANYPKAISRRATLYEMIRDYGQSANDLRKLISLLEKQANKPGVSPKVLNKHSDLKQARSRLISVEDEAKNDTPLNLYLILGVEPSCSPADIKKAYRKAALRHHPDKAAQLLVRNENADDGFWRDIAKEVYADADHLFKTIGVAYNILSDPDKRQDYDIEENLRNATRRSFKGRSTHKSPEHHHHKQYDRGFSPRQWQSAGQSSKGAYRSRWSGYSYSDDYW